MTDIREQITELRRDEDPELCATADTMEKMLAVVEAAKDFTAHCIVFIPEQDVLDEALAALEQE